MLSTSIFDLMNQRSKEVRTDFLGLGVYPMKVKEYKEELSKDKTKSMIKVVLDSGFKYETGDTNFVNVFFNVSGTYTDKKTDTEKPNIDLFVKFCKECFGIETFDQQAINKTVGQTIAVAISRNKEGYLGYWYGGNIKNIANMQANYKPKDESNGVRPERKTPEEGAIPPQAPIVEPIGYDAKGQPIYQ